MGSSLGSMPIPELVRIVTSLQEVAGRPSLNEADRLTVLLTAYLQGRADGEEDPVPRSAEPSAPLGPYDESNSKRWENGFRNIVTYVQGPRAPFTVEGIVKKVQEMRDIEERHIAALRLVEQNLDDFSEELARSEIYAGSSKADEDLLRAQIKVLDEVRKALSTPSEIC